MTQYRSQITGTESKLYLIFNSSLITLFSFNSSIIWVICMTTALTDTSEKHFDVWKTQSSAYLCGASAAIYKHCDLCTGLSGIVTRNSHRKITQCYHCVLERGHIPSVNDHREASIHGNATVLRKNLARAKIMKIEFNANLYLLGSPFYNIKECSKVP